MNIRRTESIHRIKRVDQEVKALLFADDLLRSVTCPDQSLPAAFQLLDEFANLSGLEINPAKTELLPVHIAPRGRRVDQFDPSNFKTSLMYLGIVFERTASQLLANNVTPVVARVTSDLIRWVRLPLTLRGRVQTIKMMTLASLMYAWINTPNSARQRSM